jgi:hypothetical protein
MKKDDEKNREQKLEGLFTDKIEGNIAFDSQTIQVNINEESSTHLARTEDYFRWVVYVTESYVTCSRAHK